MEVGCCLCSFGMNRFVGTATARLSGLRPATGCAGYALYPCPAAASLVEQQRQRHCTNPLKTEFLSRRSRSRTFNYLHHHPHAAANLCAVHPGRSLPAVVVARWGPDCATRTVWRWRRRQGRVVKESSRSAISDKYILPSRAACVHSYIHGRFFRHHLQSCHNHLSPIHVATAIPNTVPFKR